MISLKKILSNMVKLKADSKTELNTLPESNRIDDLTQDEIEKLARAIINQAVEESKSCSIPATKSVDLVDSYNNRTKIVQKNVITYWIH